VCEASRNHLLKDLEDIQIAHRHQSEHEFQPLAVGILRVVLGVKTKKNGLLQTVEECHRQKVKDARVYESVLESVPAIVYTSAHEGILRVIVYVFHNLLRKPASEQPMCLLWPCPAYA
jgi:hypothetical protein